MNGKRFPRALLLAVIAASVGLFWCLAVFFLLWGDSVGAKLLPFLVFGPAFVAAAVILGIFRKCRDR